MTTAEERLRREIAEFLHGRVQTRLVIAWHRLGELQELMDTDPVKARELLATVREEIDQIRERDVRQASHLLHPSIIQVGLVPAVRSLATRFEEHFDIRLEIDPEMEDLDSPIENRIPEQIRLAAYRVLEDAINNVYRHAEARAVKIDIRVAPKNQLAVSVRDDGHGFDTANFQPGLGIGSIAARVGQVGGTWEISSTIGGGTVLSAQLPLSEEEPLDPRPQTRVPIGVHSIAGG